MTDYEQYEKECAEIRTENAVLLDLFKADLEAKGLSDKTIRRHIENMDLYINDFLLREDAEHMNSGLRRLDSFFYFFIHKCMWSTPGNVKTTAASIKKFYKCMMEHGKIEKDEYSDFCEELKEGIPVWQAECAVFNDDDYEW